PLLRFVEEHTTLSDSNPDGAGWALTFPFPKRPGEDGIAVSSGFPDSTAGQKMRAGKLSFSRVFPPAPFLCKVRRKPKEIPDSPEDQAGPPSPLRSGGRKCGTLLTESLAEFTNEKNGEFNFHSPFAPVFSSLLLRGRCRA
ncbi:hypothetical protein, partial [uncultured Victivallis sp.]|uniref:hypothetical protein n=1 Tax=uncultured Victivallis sp. TaxID=354118 RepID=UPI0025FE449B